MIDDDLVNARAEFIQHIKDRVVQCADIKHIACEVTGITAKCVLPCDYTPAEYKAFLETLDFEYDAGFGAQELFGFIWYVDGTWSARYEYDGKENWSYRKRPEIPKELQR